MDQFIDEGMLTMHMHVHSHFCKHRRWPGLADPL